MWSQTYPIMIMFFGTIFLAGALQDHMMSLLLFYISRVPHGDNNWAFEYYTQLE